ncbi:class I SAM-dependent methyltransferase [Rhizobium sp. CNPSo 3464]|uniref:class I SAM-dependent methyltransferase n=1 Tax=Rhizobium sp. CNPSo 3464 TaxID=3021406 RepID=UPI00254F4A14|nr:class I SAM-dependent methyltransferase [Rhizobium sp. CNPSo 3464]MDK4741311.1 class I SAM-dependent methyltransferase [Rhizobium sp. CNPSo 3464]
MTNKRICWCGNHDLLAFSPEYGRCASCGTLVSLVSLTNEELQVSNDEADFYGKQYWLDHQSKDLGFPNIFERARKDLTDRNLHWLRTLLKYRVPPSKILELGCSHGSFVGLLRQAGYDAAGVEMSPWVVEFGQKTFDIPISVGPLENLDLPIGSLDVIALMDVLEHLPDPVGTMKHALKLLKPEGLLLIQTPQFKEEMVYQELVDSNGAFLEQFKSDEHLYLFTQQSVARLFHELGADHLGFELPMFYQYDMFFVVSRKPISIVPEKERQEALCSTTGRFVQAMLDLDERVKALDTHVKVIEADREERLDKIHILDQQIKVIDADRADRLTQILTLTQMVRDLQASIEHSK